MLLLLLLFEVVVASVATIGIRVLLFFAFLLREGSLRVGVFCDCWLDSVMRERGEGREGVDS